MESRPAVNAENRDCRIDAVKFWLIVLVITGHVIGNSLLKSTTSCAVLWKWIYMFHMPLFVFISGYFSRKKDSHHFLAGCWNIAEPLIVFQLVSLALRLVSGSDVSLKSVFTPWWVLWYLLSLLYWRLLLQVTPDKILQNTKLIIAASFAISILAGFLPLTRFLSLQRTLAFLPFFCMGYCMRGKRLFLPSKYKPWCFLFLAATMVIPILFEKRLGFLNHADPYPNIYGMYGRMLVFALSVPMSIAFLNVCPFSKWMAGQGQYTMQYYIYHAFAVPVFMKVIGVLGFPTSLFAALLYTLFIVGSIFLLLKIPLFRKLTNPSVVLKAD